MIIPLLTLMATFVSCCDDYEFVSFVTVEECAEVEHIAGYVRCELGDERISDGINELIAERVRTEAGYGAAEPDDDAEESVGSPPCDPTDPLLPRHVYSGCEQPFVFGGIVSFRCGTEYTTGMHPDYSSFAINVLIEGSGFREVTLGELFAGPEAENEFWRLVRGDLRCQLEDPSAQEVDGEIPDYLLEELSRVDERYEAFGFDETGLRISFSHSVFGYAVLDATVPYDQLHSLLWQSLVPTVPN